MGEGWCCATFIGCAGRWWLGKSGKVGEGPGCHVVELNRDREAKRCVGLGGEMSE